MASPLAKGLFHKAIGESGAFFTGASGTLALQPLATTEQAGAKFAAGVNAPIARRPACASRVTPSFKPRSRRSRGSRPIVDGYVLTEDVASTFGAGKQARVPLLAGWNADEVRAGIVLRPNKPTPESFAAENRKRFGDSADAILKAYPAATAEDALESAAALASDLFIGYSTWKWIEVHAQTGHSPVYRYSFDRKIPVAADAKMNGVAVTSRDVGARHAGEIEYVFGALDSIKNVTVGSKRPQAVGRDDDATGPTSPAAAIRTVPACRSGRGMTGAATASCTSTRPSATQPIRCGPATRRSTPTRRSSASPRAVRPPPVESALRAPSGRRPPTVVFRSVFSPCRPRRAGTGRALEPASICRGAVTPVSWPLKQ